MHARVQIAKSIPPQFNTPEASGYLVNVIKGHPGFRAIHLMLQIGSQQGLNVTLWDTRDDADGSSARTQAAMGPRPFPLTFDEVYDVLATLDGSAAMEDAKVCQMTWFDGPRSAEQNEAIRRAGEERIKPAIEHVAGFVRTYVLYHPADSATVIVNLATSTEALDRLADAVFGTDLLPGEDPALLTGPDRVEIYTVENQAVAPAAVVA